MAEENKRKFALWVHPEVLAQVQKIYKDDNCKSQSEFIEKAILFYSGFLSAEDNKKYLPQTITSTVKGIVDDSENRMARLLFKMAVEMAMMMNVTAAHFRVGEDTVKALREKCVKDVKASNGAILFVDAVKYQNS
jgi:hypothetical protein